MGERDVKKLFFVREGDVFGKTALPASIRRRILEHGASPQAQRFLKGRTLPQAPRLFKNNAAVREADASAPPDLEATAFDPFFNTQGEPLDD